MAINRPDSRKNTTTRMFNPVALARAIARLHDDPDLRARLGAAARKKALAEFDERSVISNTLAVYRELVPGM